MYYQLNQELLKLPRITPLPPPVYPSIVAAAPVPPAAVIIRGSTPSIPPIPIIISTPAIIPSRRSLDLPHGPGTLSSLLSHDNLDNVITNSSSV